MAFSDGCGEPKGSEWPVSLRVGIRPKPKDGDQLARVFEELPGMYDIHGENHGKPSYKRKKKQADDGDMYLYFWDPVEEALDGDFEDAGGWRFGRSIDVRNAWAWRYQMKETSNTPPVQGWSVKLEGRERERDHREELFVIPGERKREQGPSAATAAPASLRSLQRSMTPTRGRSPQSEQHSEACFDRNSEASARTDTPSPASPVKVPAPPSPVEVRSRSEASDRDLSQSGEGDQQSAVQPPSVADRSEADGRPRMSVRSRASHFAGKESNLSKRCINFSGKGWDDASLEQWVRERAIVLVKDLRSPRFDTIDLSRNKLTDKGLEMLVNFLLDNKVGVRRLRLFGNQFREIPSIGWVIEDGEVGAGRYLRELHLSDNKLCAEALGNILDSLRHCSRSLKGFDSPFWLRVEMNEGFAGLEDEIVKEHREKGLEICMEPGSKSSACNLHRCLHRADVHLILRFEKSIKNQTDAVDMASRRNTQYRTSRPNARSRSASDGRRQKESRYSRSTVDTVSATRPAKSIVSLRPRERSRVDDRLRHEERARSRSRSRVALPTRRVHVSRSASRHPGREDGEYVSRAYGRGSCEILLSGRSLGADDLKRWVMEDGLRLISMKGRVAWDRLDLSRNGITDRGVSRLVNLLLQNRQVVVRLMLFMNRLVEPDAICRLIEDSELGVGAPGGLAELHLSSNSITAPALKRILESLRRRARDCGHFRQPVWLRAERNPCLEGEGSEITKAYWSSSFKICLDGGHPESGCSLSYCRYHADVHLHLFGGNRANQVRERSWR